MVIVCVIGVFYKTCYIQARVCPASLFAKQAC